MKQVKSNFAAKPQCQNHSEEENDQSAVYDRENKKEFSQSGFVRVKVTATT